MKHASTIALGVFLSTSAFAQKKELLQDKETILARAAEALDASLLPGSAVYEAVIEENLIGKYVMQVSFRDKGDISSVFVVSAEGHDLRSQNRFKDLIHQGKMPFKMAKGRQYRIEHTFDLNTLQR